MRRKNGKNVKCEECGDEFYLQPHRFKNKSHTCSRSCAAKIASKRSSTKITTECKVCGKEIKYKPSRFKKIKEHTCSVECNNTNQKIKFLGRNNPNCKYNIDDNFFKNINKEKAYILGWIASDGSISKSGFRISIHKRDVLILKKIRDLICKELPIITPKSKPDMVDLTINSKTISEDLCGIFNIKPGKKSHTIDFPKIDDGLFWIFLRGLFDGDGSINNPNKWNIERGYPLPKVSIASCSTRMVKGILDRINIPNYVYEGGIEFWGNNSVDFLGKLYEDRDVPYLARKKDLYLDWSIYVPGLSGRSNNLRNVHFKCVKTRKDAVLPYKTNASDSGYDITLLECVKKVDDIEYFDTGIKIQPMYGWGLFLVPRSSFSKTGYMLANQIGILDRTYTGNILVCLRKVNKDLPDLELPSRCMQLIPLPTVNFEIIEVDDFEETSRSDGGFGSTGN